MSEEEINKMIEVYDEVIAELQQENSQLKERIEKAIEYINNPWSIESGNKKVDEITHKKKKETIEILKGDKE